MRTICETRQHRLQAQSVSMCPYVALPLITQAVGWHFVAHSLLEENTEFALIFDLDEFLRPVGRVRDVQLHLVNGLNKAVKTGGKSQQIQRLMMGNVRSIKDHGSPCD